jgi:hypothetical protein
MRRLLDRATQLIEPQNERLPRLKDLAQIGCGHEKANPP